MIRAVKQLSEQEACFTQFWTKCMLQLAIEVDSPTVIPELVDFFDNHVLGLHLHLEGQNLLSTRSRSKINQLPNYVNSLSEGALFAYQNYTPTNPSDGFCSISSNDKMIVLNVPHSLGDGGYFKFLVDNFLTNRNLRKSETDVLDKHPFPIDVHDIFATEIQKAREGPVFIDDPEISRFNSRLPPQKGTEASFFTFRTDPTKMKAYNQKNSQNGHVFRFSEFQWLSLFLSKCVNDGFLNKNVGIATCMDLRNFTNEPSSYGHCCCIAPIISVFNGVNKDMTIDEVGANLRKSFDARLKAGKHFSFLKSQNQNHKVAPGSPLEISNVGSFNIKKPITNVYASLSSSTHESITYITLMGFSVKHENGRNDLSFRISYNPNYINGREMEAFGKCNRYFLENMTFDMKIGDSFEELKKYYESVF
ncbi:hypothetical protein TRFO_37398 [Tritrichomonas foetus]|uniref:Uncharacterized protein n=1 Tax=Tritrichomonas foetus TaxID=1144522 RepID=A0A1J4JB85_9EUKA|nr:hypothetical protein TRFO_37398 [Tritrichomonas foetus]|eukprot:OHS96446.1 hypothetical protein TRFO_37398 [Tritrichomonas foetus]